MFTRQATVIAIVGVILAACSAGTAPTASPPASPSPSHRPPSLATVSPSPTTPITTPTPTATAGPTAKATPVPVPPKPTGVRFDASDDCLSESCHRYTHTRTVTWRAPRTEGVEIRVYGVTECLSVPARPKPGTDGPCLVKNTRLPASVRTLLAKAPASAGKVIWSWIDHGDLGCNVWWPVAWAPDWQEYYYAVVVAAYSESGHSIFAIAATGTWVEPDWESGDLYC